MTSKNKITFGADLIPLDPSFIGPFAKYIEDHGFSHIWVADVNFNSDVYVALTTIALHTKRVYLGPGVTNPLTRHPAYTGIAIASLNALSRGRAKLALGTGDYHIMRELKLLPEKPIRALKEGLSIIRRVLNNEEFEHTGEFYHISHFKMTIKNPSSVPIYIAGKGPTILRTAGEVGDGVYLDAIPPEAFPTALKFIEKGLVKSGRSLKDFYLIDVIGLVVNKDREKALQDAKKDAIFAVTSAPKYIREALGIDMETIDHIKSKFPDTEAAINAVPLDVAERLAIAGTPEDCIEKISKLEKLGVNQISVIIYAEEKSKKRVKSIYENVISYFEEQ